MGPTTKRHVRFVQMVVWTHEPRSSEEEVIVDMSLIPNAQEGDVAEIRTIEDKPKKIFFIVKKNTDTKMANVQLSLYPQLLAALEVSPRSTLQVKLRKKKEIRADTLEVLFRDAYMTRADMWRMSRSLIGKCIYDGQRISYLGVVRMTVSEIYRTKSKTMSAYVDEDTKLVYRSAAARSIFFIQMSSEMWNFEENSEVIFHKLVNSFLPEVFRKWRDSEAHHVVTIVLFSSVDVSERRIKLQQGERGKDKEDYFRVVVDQVQVSRWSHIMARLRYEFQRFQEDVLLRADGQIKGRILPAVKGNIMEAMTLAITLVSNKFNDRDLRRTNLEVVIVTPGTGIFDVDYDLFYQTSMKLLSIEIGIDIVCLSRQPLHVTPLFRFREADEVVNALPSWLDISFWHARERHNQQWIPRCKIYEIQMMGLMENDVSSISVEYLQKPTQDRTIEKIMDDYDQNIFLSKVAISNQRVITEAIDRGKVATLLRPKISKLEITASTNSRAFSDNTPTTAIFSSPVEGGSSATLLASTMKTPRKISTLTSLLLGRGGSEGADKSSPRLDARSPSLVSQYSTGSGASTTVADSSITPLHSTITGPSSPKKTDLKKVVIPNSYSTLGRNRMGSASIAEGKLSTSPRYSDYLAKKPYGNLKWIPGNSTSSPPSSNSGGFKSGFKNEDLDANNHAWVTIPNPSNVPRDKLLNISNYGRWKNVFSKVAKRQTVKWRSIKSPASLPLSTNIFPSLDEFQKNFTVQNYDITLEFEQEDHMTPGDLLEEMVAMRLHIGFQIAVGDAVSEVEARMRPDGNPSMITQTIPKDYRDIRVYMTRANEIHRLVISASGTINVQLYSKPNLLEKAVSGSYQPYVKAKYDDTYKQTQGNFFDPSVRIVNWNSLDQLLAGYDDIQENERLFKVRFVLIPTDAARNNSSTSGEEKLTLEEMRVDGLRKIVINLHRNAFLTGNERELKKKQRKEIVAPEILFYTGDLASYLQQLMDTDSAPGKVFSERINRSIKLKEFALEVLSPENGIKLSDRKWHRKTHKNCFVGHQLVAWLIENFTDIATTEEAVEYGNELMEKGLFVHVEHRHTFLDGHYFYQINAEFLPRDHRAEDKPAEKQRWFAKNTSGSVETTPELTGVAANQPRKISGTNISDLNAAAVRKSSSASTADNSTLMSATSLSTVKPPSRKAFVSAAVKVDVDPQRRSSRQESVTVHVDRAHNPDNAFHLRLEWFNTTPKLIDEMIVSLGRIADQNALKLVQVPIEEISQIPESNPFCSVVRTSFVVSPFDLVIRPDENPLSEDPLIYHKYFLSYMGFCPDMGAASDWIVGDLDILCSWGRPFYNYNQFIHKSGTVLCQIMGNNEFILMTNTLHVSRISIATSNAPAAPVGQGVSATPMLTAAGQSSPQSSASQGALCLPPNLMTDPDEIQELFKRLCEEEPELTKIFNKARLTWSARRSISASGEPISSDSGAAPSTAGKKSVA